MPRLAILFVLLFAAAAALAETATSRSGQFVIIGVGPDIPKTYVPEVATDPNLVKVEPALLAISCERIKQALLGALGVADQWRGRIRIILHPARSANEEMVVLTSLFKDVWTYQVSLPDHVEPNRLVRLFTQTLLMEIANRQQPSETGRLPAWLAEGMPQYLIATTDMALVLQPTPWSLGNELTQKAEVRDRRHANPFSKARDRLRQREPLPLETLGNPSPDDLAGPAGDIYRDNALLFINELLQLKNGGACLAAMLPELPWDVDWRVAFLKGFNQHFKRLRDFEKWWALQSAYFASRDPGQTWPRQESLSKLREALRTPFAVTLASNEPPLYTDVSLQAVTKGWTIDRQVEVLQEKLKLLDNLQLRLAPELKPLAKQYRDVMAEYLGKIETSRAVAKKGRAGKHPFGDKLRESLSRPPDEALLRSTVDQLDVLDSRCAAWKVTHDALPGVSP